MTSSDWHLSLKLVNQPKSTFHFPDMMPGDVPPGGYRIATVKQLVAAQIPDSIPDPELIEPVNRATAAREFRVFHAALHSLNSAYRDSVYKMLTNKESLDQIIVATPGLRSDPVALGVLQDKDLFVQFTDPTMLDILIASHPALVNAIILVLHSVAGSIPAQASAGSSRNVSASSYSDMPGEEATPRPFFISIHGKPGKKSPGIIKMVISWEKKSKKIYINPKSFWKSPGNMLY
ncbi:Ubiquitin-like protein 7 [Liparis tanakae]|uniref:Ubiquitin-like protein 7 n=1 Tax=Liparis tanakae TaxID=230148 RepID=A0A4Z2F1C3_9TELE|nr:Ubiquitin-like protein 7 [Liparis tanakae]